jgi:hypothetical protein
MMAYVIVHETMGIYLGNCMGMGFWTLLDPVGQPSAATFSSIRDAQEHVLSWENNNHLADYRFVPVQEDVYHGASIKALKEAGLSAYLGDMEKDYLRYSDSAGRA